MALEDIISKIKEDAAAEVSRLKADTDREVDSIISECEEECRRIAEEAREEGERLAGDARNRMKIQANLDGRKDLLSRRKDLIEQVFTRIGEGIRSDEKQYIDFLIRTIVESASSGNEKVVFSSEDLESLGDKLQNVVSEANKQLFDTGKKGELVLAGEGGDFSGGFILKKGKTNTVMTMDTFIQTLRDSYESDIARILSGENV